MVGLRLIMIYTLGQIFFSSHLSQVSWILLGGVRHAEVELGRHDYQKDN